MRAKLVNEVRWGGENISKELKDELEYDKSVMQQAMADAFYTPADYILKHNVKVGDIVITKTGDEVKIKRIDDKTKTIEVRVFPVDEEELKYFKKGYFDITWSFKQFDSIIK